MYTKQWKYKQTICCEKANYLMRNVDEIKCKYTDITRFTKDDYSTRSVGKNTKITRFTKDDSNFSFIFDGKYRNLTRFTKIACLTVITFHKTGLLLYLFILIYNIHRLYLQPYPDVHKPLQFLLNKKVLHIKMTIMLFPYNSS
jgi:hypothetical protein